MQRYECQDVQAVLSGLLDGELDADASHLAEAHLSQCAPCRAALQQAEETDDLLRATMASYEVWPTDLDRRIRTAIFGEVDEMQTIHRRRRLLFAAWSGWSMAALVMLGFGFSLSQGWFRSSANSTGSVAIDQEPVVKTEPTAALWTPPVGSEVAAASIFNTDRLPTPTSLTEEVSTKVDEPEAREQLAIAPSRVVEPSSPVAERITPPADRSFSPGVVAGVESEVETGTWMQLLALSSPVKTSNEPAAVTVEPDPAPKAILAVSQEPTDPATGEVLHQASVLLTVLEQAGEGSFSDVRMVQQALSSDDVLERLASARSDLQSPDSVDLVNRAWSMLEWTNGSVDQDELERVKRSIAMQDLPRRLERLSDQYWN